MTRLAGVHETPVRERFNWTRARDEDHKPSQRGRAAREEATAAHPVRAGAADRGRRDHDAQPRRHDGLRGEPRVQLQRTAGRRHRGRGVEFSRRIDADSDDLGHDGHVERADDLCDARHDDQAVLADQTPGRTLGRSPARKRRIPRPAQSANSVSHAMTDKSGFVKSLPESKVCAKTAANATYDERWIHSQTRSDMRSRIQLVTITAAKRSSETVPRPIATTPYDAMNGITTSTGASFACESRSSATTWIAPSGSQMRLAASCTARSPRLCVKHCRKPGRKATPDITAIESATVAAAPG